MHQSGMFCSMLKIIDLLENKPEALKINDSTDLKRNLQHWLNVQQGVFKQ